jgi:hypothetical protein
VVTLAASIALVFAGLFDAFGLPKWLGGRWVGDRLAALCVLFAVGYFLSGSWVDHTAATKGREFTTWVAHTLAPWLGPKVADAIGLYALGLIVFVLFVMWLGMLWPNRGGKGTKKAAPGAGMERAARGAAPAGKGGGGWKLTSLELESRYIWIPPAVFTLGAVLVPGALGTFVRGTIGLLASLGQAFGSGLA